MNFDMINLTSLNCRPQMITGVFAAVVLLAGCADIASSACPAGMAHMVRAELFFGLSIPGGGQVSDEAWQSFVAHEITPRFPDGFTVQNGLGVWKGSKGPVAEDSRIVTVVSPHLSEAELDAIRQAYKRRFHQDSVLKVEQPVCAGF